MAFPTGRPQSSASLGTIVRNGRESLSWYQPLTTVPQVQCSERCIQIAKEGWNYGVAGHGDRDDVE